MEQKMLQIKQDSKCSQPYFEIKPFVFMEMRTIPYLCSMKCCKPYKNMKYRFFFLTILLFTLACTQEKKQSTTSKIQTVENEETNISGNIYITVDENFEPIIKEEIAVFESLYPKAKIHALYMPGEDAINRMASSDSFRLAIACRNANASEMTQIQKQDASLRPMPIAQDAIAMIVNKANADSTLTIQQMKDIVAGKLTNWKEINPQSTLGNILLVFDNTRSGTVQFLRDSVLTNEKINSKAFTAKNSVEVLDYVGKNAGAIGVIGVNWISDSDDRKYKGFLTNNRIVRLESPKDCGVEGQYLQPYPGIVKLGCYPLIRNMYALNRESGFKLGTAFVSFLCNGTNGQRVILKAGLVPMYAVSRYVRFPAEQK